MVSEALNHMLKLTGCLDMNSQRWSVDSGTTRWGPRTEAAKGGGRGSLDEICYRGSWRNAGGASSCIRVKAQLLLQAGFWDRLDQKPSQVDP